MTEIKIIIIMLVLVSLTSSVVVGLIGYVNGRDSLTQAAFDRLIEVRDSRAREMRGLFESIESTLLLNARGESVANARTPRRMSAATTPPALAHRGARSSPP